MLVYTVRIWEQFESQYPQKRLPLIYPMVIYQGQKTWSAPLSVHDALNVPEYMRPFCPEMRYELMDLSALTDDDIQGEILQRMVLLVMRNIDSATINESLFGTYLPLFSELTRKKRGIEYIEDMLYYLSYKSDHMDKDIVIERLGRVSETENLREVIMTLAEKWEQQGIEKGIEKGIERGMEKGIKKGIERGIEKGIKKGIERGIEKGIEKGIEEGIDQGKIRLVSKLLTIKFRDDAVAWINKLGQLSSDELDTIGERILIAESLSDVFQGVGK
jgi:hypothetical protein